MTSSNLVAGLLMAAAGLAQADDFVRTLANDGNLLMEDIPDVPKSVALDVYEFQSVGNASVLDWTLDGESLFVNARFAEVNQIHRVDMPMGTRRPLTFFNELISFVKRRPRHSELLFARDIDGDELTQLLLLNVADGTSKMLTDGKSRNDAAVWDRTGQNLAFMSTRRNGASNDIWMMDADDPDSARIVLESNDGSWWGPQEFSASGDKLLVGNYQSIANSCIVLLDLVTGDRRVLSGGEELPSANYPVGFDHNDSGYWFITDHESEFGQLAWQSMQPGAPVEYLTSTIPWDVSSAALSNNRRQMAFVANEAGMSRLYLMDTATHQYRAVRNLPVGLVFGLVFSPDDTQLAFTLNTPRTPSDTFALTLGKKPLEYGPLTRWTESKAGANGDSRFIAPDLVHYPTFDKVDGEARTIPAWVYRPPVDDGPLPVIISIHGGPESQSRPYFSSTYQMWLATLGAAIVVPNVRGSSGYGKTYLGLDDGFRREDAVRDIGALLDWIAEHPDLDEKRVAVYGGSYGGYMALATAAHYSDRLKAVVDVVGISNFVTFLENTKDYRRDLRRQEYGDERDPEMRAFMERISPLNNVQKINVPLMVVQGQNDPRVPVSESEQLVTALRDRGLPVWYMNAMNEGHGYKNKENRDIYQQAMVLFFREYLTGNNLE